MVDLIADGVALKKLFQDKAVTDPQTIRMQSARKNLLLVKDSAISAESAEEVNQQQINNYASNNDHNNPRFKDKMKCENASVAEAADVAEIQSEKSVSTAELLRNECGLSFESNIINTNCLIRKQVTEFVQISCQGFLVSVSQVMEHLLSSEDISDIVNGNIPMETLKLHIELWIAKGMPHYSSRSD